MTRRVLWVLIAVHAVVGVLNRDWLRVAFVAIGLLAQAALSREPRRA